MRGKEEQLKRRKKKWKRKDPSKWISREECEVERKMMVRNKKPKTKGRKRNSSFIIVLCRYTCTCARGGQRVATSWKGEE
jgi:hypothetical protein